VKSWIFICFIVMAGFTNSFGNEFSLIFNVNGHEYQIDDDISEVLMNQWETSKAQTAVDIVADDDDITALTFGNIETAEYSQIDNNNFQLNLKITNTYIKVVTWRFGDIYQKEDAGYLSFILKLNITQEMTSNGLTLKIVDYDITNLDMDWFYDLFNTWEWLTGNELLGGDFITSIEAYQNEEITLIPLSDFAAVYGHPVVPGADAASLAESAINSLPFEYSFEVKEVDNNVLLQINLDIITSYTDENGIEQDFTLGTGPQIQSQRIIDYCGISGSGDWEYDLVNAGSWQNDITNYFNKMGQNDLKFNITRQDVMWNKVVPIIDWTIPFYELNYETYLNNGRQITESMIITYTQMITDYSNIDQTLEVGWNYISHLINAMKLNGIEPIITLGKSYKGSTAIIDAYSFDNNLSGDKSICPGTNRSTIQSIQNSHLGVDEDLFLFLLELYARSVVRKYKDDVDLWAGDLELNAARYAESYDYFRAGSAWSDNSFQDRVIEVLSESVHEEDPINGKFMQDFHVMTLNQRLYDWQDYYDIVGLHFYGNEKVMGNAVLVLGFIPGELVFSTKRALDAMGIDKEVWISETGYPADTEEQLDENATINEHLHSFTYKRQTDYLHDALEGAAKYGAERFMWYALIENSKNLWGLAENINEIKPAGSTFSHYFDGDTSSPNRPVWIQFNTEYEDGLEDLDHDIKINTYSQAVSNNEFRWLFEGAPYTASIMEKTLEKSGSVDVYHNRWNNEHLNFKNDYSFDPVILISKEIKANYSMKMNVQIKGHANGVEIPLTHLRVRDPWYSTVDGLHPNTFIYQNDSQYKMFKDQNMDQIPGHPDYSVKVEKFYTTMEAIYELSHWEVWENGSKVSDIGSGSTKAYVVQSDMPETKVVILAGNLSWEMLLTRHRLNCI
ncbi:hypothetical protein KAJ27_19395, partial [bacterium]|nr:hypothetical protein [bacterium]